VIGSLVVVLFVEERENTNRKASLFGLNTEIKREDGDD
jgi:hypothetical protein